MRDDSGRCWSRWLAVDIDRHDEKADPEATRKFALGLYEWLRALGFQVLLLDSNGRGGFHLLVIFDGPVPTEKVHRFGRWLVRDWQAHGLTEAAEVFPKQEAVTAEGRGSYGNWLRLLGRHHTRDHWSRVWDGGRWLDGEPAILAILATTGTSADKIPAEALQVEKPKRAAPKRSGMSTGTGNDVEVAREAPACIPNSGDGLSYDDWLRIGMALSELRSDGLALFHWWSEQSSKYDHENTGRKFASFTPGDGVKLGTLFFEAKKRGWVAPKGAKIVWPGVNDAAGSTVRGAALGERRRRRRRPCRTRYAGGMRAYDCRGQHPSPRHADRDTGRPPPRPGPLLPWHESFSRRQRVEQRIRENTRGGRYHGHLLAGRPPVVR